MKNGGIVFTGFVFKLQASTYVILCLANQTIERWTVADFNSTLILTLHLTVHRYETSNLEVRRV